MSKQLQLRPNVAAFAQEMERALRRNDHKSGWRRCTKRFFRNRLEEECEELFRAMGLECRHCGQRSFDATNKENTTKEAADVANYAMMIADVFGDMEVAP